MTYLGLELNDGDLVRGRHCGLLMDLMFLIVRESWCVMKDMRLTGGLELTVLPLFYVARLEGPAQKQEYVLRRTPHQTLEV